MPGSFQRGEGNAPYHKVAHACNQLNLQVQHTSSTDAEYLDIGVN